MSLLSLRARGFRHGVHPPESKSLTAAKQIRRMPYPDEVVLPIRQHAGKPARVYPRRSRNCLNTRSVSPQTV